MKAKTCKYDGFDGSSGVGRLVLVLVLVMMLVLELVLVLLLLLVLVMMMMMMMMMMASRCCHVLTSKGYRPASFDSLATVTLCTSLKSFQLQGFWVVEGYRA